ncbi:rho GTPase-activating protein gacK [Condylostylus longicornis]|uniref:rho GTPase-activating protein gacK n=1 Tax=Condylostylus longicornis TaxID=2530218 RepID=UPI00244E5BAE|nr:rho GTPase-activating protein gacK [Condylostylus longicornis]XP_055383422.1 rho GTPase-activating protein gacK [Condylostylus longicornis]
MPSKKKKYNARFPAGRIKKIMQSDEEVGKVAQAVPVIISRTLELFVESLLTKTLKITNSRNAKTLSPSHMKQCIMSENQFDFLRELVKNIPDISVNEECGSLNDSMMPVSPSLESPPPTIQPHTPITPIQQEPYDLSRPSTSCEFNFQKHLTSIQLQNQQPLGIAMSNGQSSPLIRNGNNISNNQQQQQLLGISSSPPVVPIQSPSSSSSHGIEITCKNSVIAKISIPTLSTDNNLRENNTPEIGLENRNDLKRSWESMSRLRHHTQPPLKCTTTTNTSANTTIQSIVSSLNPAASLSTLYSPYSKNNSTTINETSLDSSSSTPPKISRLNSINTQQDQQQQSQIMTSLKLPKLSTANINNSSTIGSKEDIEISQKLSTEINKKQENSMVIQKPIVSIDENISNKPIVNIDYSNLKLLQYDANSSKTISNTDNKLNKTINKKPEITNSPVINIDLSKIATQPPTINFNFSNLLTPDNVSNNSKILSSTTGTTTATTTLELDEDYDNI